MPDLRSRYLGALLGLACGDAVGTTVEFSPRGTFKPRKQSWSSLPAVPSFRKMINIYVAAVTVLNRWKRPCGAFSIPQALKKRCCVQSILGTTLIRPVLLSVKL